MKDIDKTWQKWVNKFNIYEHCDKREGAKCYECHCKYSILHFKNNTSIYFTCGRPNNKSERN